MGRSQRDAFYGVASKGTEVQSEDMSDAFSLSLSLSVLLYCLFLSAHYGVSVPQQLVRVYVHHRVN